MTVPDPERSGRVPTSYASSSSSHGLIQPWVFQYFSSVAPRISYIGRPAHARNPPRVPEWTTWVYSDRKIRGDSPAYVFLDRPHATPRTSPYFATQCIASTSGPRLTHRIGTHLNVYTSQEQAAHHGESPGKVVPRPSASLMTPFNTSGLGPPSSKGGGD